MVKRAFGLVPSRRFGRSLASTLSCYRSLTHMPEVRAELLSAESAFEIRRGDGRVGAIINITARKTMSEQGLKTARIRTMSPGGRKPAETELEQVIANLEESGEAQCAGHCGPTFWSARGWRYGAIVAASLAVPRGKGPRSAP
jgi:hypothetical protein